MLRKDGRREPLGIKLAIDASRDDTRADSRAIDFHFVRVGISEDMPAQVWTYMPFLYPTCLRSSASWRPIAGHAFRKASSSQSTASYGPAAPTRESSHFNPESYDYSRSIFQDNCEVSIQAGAGGNGCVSFLRDRFIENGPPNGGDGGTGGNVYIQAVHGETSLHKIARRRMIRAGKGKNGAGSGKNGQRGEDVLLEVPIGTVVREISRFDPVQAESDNATPTSDDNAPDGGMVWSRSNKWLLSPAAMPKSFTNTAFPSLPRPRRSNLSMLQPSAPITLDLATPQSSPQLLAAGTVGGLGNARFVTKSVPRPPYATRGDAGMRLKLKLELKLLADLALVGAPNAGKSTLLRALSNARARVGGWAFTTLAPNIGTVVLDSHTGRARHTDIVSHNGGEKRTKFTVADVPGLVPDAHLDKGLGLDFLRHVEKARALAFVLDLSNDEEPADALKWLWRELREFEVRKQRELHERTEQHIEKWETFGSSSMTTAAAAAHQNAPVVDANQGGVRQSSASSAASSDEPVLTPLSAKPWFVVATKADVDGTQERFETLRCYLEKVSNCDAPHPTGCGNAWDGPIVAIPVSAIQGEGADGVIRRAAGLLARY